MVKNQQYTAEEQESLDKALADMLAFVENSSKDSNRVFVNTAILVHHLVKSLDRGQLYMLGANLSEDLPDSVSHLFNGLRAHSTKLVPWQGHR